MVYRVFERKTQLLQSYNPAIENCVYGLGLRMLMMMMTTEVMIVMII